jgi:hypothetical protein
MKILLVVLVIQFLNLLAFIRLNQKARIWILALRQQLNIYRRKSKKPVLRNRAILVFALRDLPKLDI